MRENPFLRIVLSATVVALFYGALFTGLAPAPKPVGELTVDRAKMLMETSRALMRDGDYTAALAPLRELHEAFPSSHIYIDRLAVVYHQMNRFAEEAALLEEFLVKAPHPEEACPRIGLAYRALEQEAKAFDAFKRCFDIDATNPDAIFYFALANERGGRLAKAAELYDRGLELAPTYDDIRLGLARIALRQDEPDKAKSAAVAVLATHPDNTDALLVAGLACMRTGEAARARTYLERGVRLAPNDHDLIDALARTERR